MIRSKNIIPASIATMVLMSNPLIQARADEPKQPQPLNFYGLTLYGVLDAGVAYQNHGAPYNGALPSGMEYLPLKSADNHQTAVTDNGMSQSLVGLKGKFNFDDEWSGVFDLQTAIDPVTGQLADGPKSIAQNNGVALNRQSSNGDSSYAGQIINGSGWFGLASKRYGEFRIGRQGSLMRDNILKYDPLGASYAFSILGFSGVAAGAGATEDARLNNALRYANDFGTWRLAALYASPSDQGGRALQGSLGADVAGLSIDATASQKKQAIMASPLGVASTGGATSISALTPGSGWLPSAANIAAGYSYASTGGPTGQYSISNSLVGTVADVDAYGLMANYTLNSVKFYGGYEHLSYSNPSDPLAAGYSTIGGYTLGVVNNGAFSSDKTLAIQWLGAKYTVVPALDLTGAFYHYRQNSYSGDACAAAQSTSSYTVYGSSPCSSGTMNGYSLVADYRYNGYVDVYAGVTLWNLTGGLASGYMNTSTSNVMTGARVRF